MTVNYSSAMESMRRNFDAIYEDDMINNQTPEKERPKSRQDLQEAMDIKFTDKSKDEQ